MANRRRSVLTRVVVAGLLFGAAWLGRPINAEAQVRGTLQVSAQVVDTKASFEGLNAARVALRQAAAGTQVVNLDMQSAAALRASDGNSSKPDTKQKPKSQMD